MLHYHISQWHLVNTAMFMKPLCFEILYVYNNAKCFTFHISINYLQRYLHFWSEHDLSLALELFNLRIVVRKIDLTSFPLADNCQCMLTIHSFSKHLITVYAVCQALLECMWDMQRNKMWFQALRIHHLLKIFSILRISSFVFTNNQILMFTLGRIYYDQQ